MSNFDDLCSVLENLDPRTYRDLMMKKTQDILVAFGAMSEDTEDCIALYCDFLLCAVAADGVLTEEEFLLSSLRTKDGIDKAEYEKVIILF